MKKHFGILIWGFLVFPNKENCNYYSKWLRRRINLSYSKPSLEEKNFVTLLE